MSDKGLKRTRGSLTSSCSELNTTSSSVLDSSAAVYPVFKSKSKRRKRREKTDQQTTSRPAEMASAENQLISQSLSEINEKLSNVLTKDDTAFIKTIIKDTVHQIKDQILSSVTRRIEVIEGDIFECHTQIKSLKDKLKIKQTENEKLQESVRSLSTQCSRPNTSFEQNKNENEQYSRLNSVRIMGLAGDSPSQSSEVTTRMVIEKLNVQTGLRLDEHDVDIAHRLGDYRSSKPRSVIVKFTRRQTKVNVLKNAKKFKGTNIFINEDLTKLNAEVLASLRLKDKKSVERAWSFDGKLYAQFKGQQKGERITDEQYKLWLSKPWPIKG